MNALQRYLANRRLLEQQEQLLSELIHNQSQREIVREHFEKEGIEIVCKSESYLEGCRSYIDLTSALRQQQQELEKSESVKKYLDTERRKSAYQTLKSLYKSDRDYFRIHIEKAIKNKKDQVPYADMIVMNLDSSKVLLLRRNYETEYFPNAYGLPGGHIDLGEDSETAARRECLEETGIKVESVDLFKVFEDEKTHISYYTTRVDENITITLDQTEHQGYIWCRFEDLKNERLLPNLLDTLLEAAHPERIQKAFNHTNKRLEKRRDKNGHLINRWIKNNLYHAEPKRFIFDHRSPMERSTANGLVERSPKGARISQTLFDENLSRSGRRTTEGVSTGWNKLAFLKQLESNARRDDTWIEDIDIIAHKDRKLKPGSENEPYEARIGNNLIKVNNFSFMNQDNSEFENTRDFDYFLDRLNSHNELFPDVAYTVEGFIKNTEGDMSIILRQPRISGIHPTEDQIDTYLRSRGFERREVSTGTNGYYNGYYEISDVKPANVLVDENNNFYFIDLDVSSINYLHRNNKDSHEQSINIETTSRAGSTTTSASQRAREIGSIIGQADNLSLRTEREGNGSHHESATDDQRRNGSSDENGHELARPNTNRTESEILEKYFRDNGQLYSFTYTPEGNLKSELGEWRFYAKGAEADIYLDTQYILNSGKPELVYKIVNPRVTVNDLNEYLTQRLKGHNELFPDVAYELEGATIVNDELMFVVSQPRVQHFGSPITHKEIAVDLEKRGFKGHSGVFTNGIWTVEDLHVGNVLRAEDGSLLYIDPQIYEMDQEDVDYFNQYDENYVEKAICDELEKSVRNILGQPRTALFGEIRVWSDGNRYRKVGPGRWVRVRQEPDVSRIDSADKVAEILNDFRIESIQLQADAESRVERDLLNQQEGRDRGRKGKNPEGLSINDKLQRKGGQLCDFFSTVQREYLKGNISHLIFNPIAKSDLEPSGEQITIEVNPNGKGVFAYFTSTGYEVPLEVLKEGLDKGRLVGVSFRRPLKGSTRQFGAAKVR